MYCDFWEDQKTPSSDKLYIDCLIFTKPAHRHNLVKDIVFLLQTFVIAL